LQYIICRFTGKSGIIHVTSTTISTDTFDYCFTPQFFWIYRKLSQEPNTELLVTDEADFIGQMLFMSWLSLN